MGKGLCDEVYRTALHRLDGNFDCAVSGHHHDIDIRPALLDLLKDLHNSPYDYVNNYFLLARLPIH